MEIGMIGLGRMGANMARRLARGGVKVAAFNRSYEVTAKLAHETGLKACATIPDLLGELDKPRVIWLMLPAAMRPSRRWSIWFHCWRAAMWWWTAPTLFTRIP